MNGKAIAAIMAIIGLVTVLLNGSNPTMTPFQQWKTKFGVQYESLFE